MTLKIEINKKEKMYHRLSFSTNGWEFKLLERGVKSAADFSSEINTCVLHGSRLYQNLSFLLKNTEQVWK